MTIDEAIKHAEEIADTCEYEASKYDMSDSYESHVACQEGKCAEEHRQLAEWLKELKRLKEQEPTIDKIRAEILDTLYVDSLIFGELIDFKNGKISADDVIEEFNRVTRLEVLRIIDEYKTESEE